MKTTELPAIEYRNVRPQESAEVLDFSGYDRDTRVLRLKAPQPIGAVLDINDGDASGMVIESRKALIYADVQPFVVRKVIPFKPDIPDPLVYTTEVLGSVDFSFNHPEGTTVGWTVDKVIGGVYKPLLSYHDYDSPGYSQYSSQESWPVGSYRVRATLYVDSTNRPLARQSTTWELTTEQATLVWGSPTSIRFKK